MMMERKQKAGKRTGQFGKWLTEALRDQPEYQVYYDHGDPQKHGNVGVIKAFLGEKVASNNKLADVDILVANQEDEIILLIEIEESPLSPKTLLGDVFASVLSTGFAVNTDGKQTYFQVTPNTQLWVVGYVPGKSVEKAAFIQQLERKIADLIAGQEGITVTEVRLVVENDLNTSLRELRKLCRRNLFTT